MTAKLLIRQFLLYGVVGAIACLADWVSLWGFTELVHLHYLISAAMAFIIGLAINYSLSTQWVFSEHRLSNKKAEFIIFSIIGVVGLFLNEILIYIITTQAGTHYMLSKLISTAIVFLWNFGARKIILYTNR